MAKKPLNKIFLSASVPLPERHPRYYETADFIAIRDAVKALATVIVPQCHLVWGGHPSITPLIRHVIERMDGHANEHVTLYQSMFFAKNFPKANLSFENTILTPEAESIKESLSLMREKMIGENDFVAGIFIGGMEGILDEYEIFIKHHPNALVFPIASTGAGANILFNTIEGMGLPLDDRLLGDYAYMSLFRDLLKDYLSPLQENG